MPVKKVVPPSLLERGQILAANMAANDGEAEELVLALAEKYRPPNLAATVVRGSWHYGRVHIAEVLRRAVKHCEDNAHAQYSTPVNDGTTL
jgi:hypothetical protein